MPLLESLKLVIGSEAGGEEDSAGSEEVSIAGDIRAAVDSGDDQALADALKQFIYVCLEAKEY